MSKKFLATITTYAFPAFVDLGLYYMTSYPECDVIVIDDCSRNRKLSEVCQKYNVPLLSNERHFNHTGGDLNMQATAIEYAYNNGYEYVLKMSRRWICLDNPFPALEKCIQESHGYTFSNITVMYNFGFRTEFIIFKSEPWYNNVVKMRHAVLENNYGLVEAFVHNLAKETQPNDETYRNFKESHPYREYQDGYVHFDWMGTDRRTQYPQFIWHDAFRNHWNTYFELSSKAGLNWKLEDFKI